MTKELKSVRDALERLIHCGQKQGFNDGYATEMDDARQALTTLDSIMAGGVEIPLFGYEICGKYFFAGTMKNNGGKVDDIWWMTDITDYSDDAVQRQIKRVEFINRAMNTAAPKHGGNPVRPLIGCAASRDGECNHPDCPQLKEYKTSCPLITENEDY